MKYYPLFPSNIEVLTFKHSKFYQIDDEVFMFLFITEKHLSEQEQIRRNCLGKILPKYVVAHRFSKNFEKHTSHILEIEQDEVFSYSQEDFYQENGKFLLNTKKFFFI